MREKGRKNGRPIRLELDGHQNLDLLKKLGRTQLLPVVAQSGRQEAMRAREGSAG